ncbi:MAG: polysaccharide deacetylase family protein [Bdellovibrionales bacterium]|nr:polysaccharide deacetylase family protein [Bdellovibrionales bacterium]
MLILLWAFLFHAAAEINFTAEIQKVLTIHNQSNSYSDWKLNDYYPAHKLKDLYHTALNKKSTDQYCKSLLSLPALELYFLDSFLIADKTISKSCHTKVTTNLVNFRYLKTNKLNNYIKKNYKPSKPQINSKELYVDPTGGKILYDGQLSDNHFLLTFDDGPHPRVTPRILKTLENNKILSQFFIVGNRVQYWPELLKQTQQQGHVVANHSWSHPDMRKLSLGEAVSQIQNTFSEIEKVLGPSEPFFRFPYGAYNFDQLEYLGQKDVVSFFWNIDTFDWKIKDPEELLKFSIKKIKEKPSGIILMHDIHNQTADMLPYLLDYLNSRSAQTVIFKSN